MTETETTSSEVIRYCSPAYFLGSLMTDEAPVEFAVKLARGYAAALEDDRTDLYEWTQAMAAMCLSRDWQEAAIAMLATESEGLKLEYLKRAGQILDPIDHKEG